MFYPNRFKTINEDAIFPLDFDHSLNQELIIKPGEKSAEISVNVTEDNVPENNETFLLTLMALDKVITITSGSTRITILNNGKSYMRNTHNKSCVIAIDTERGLCQEITPLLTVNAYNNN